MVPTQPFKPHLLLVEDDPSQWTFFLELLQPHYEVTLAINGQRAWELAQANTPDLILSDVIMPELDGFELTRRLRQYRPTAEVPIILLSASSAIDLMVRGLRAGANDVRLKPFKVEELLATLRTWVSK